MTRLDRSNISKLRDSRVLSKAFFFFSGLFHKIGNSFGTGLLVLFAEVLLQNKMSQRWTKLSQSRSVP